MKNTKILYCSSLLAIVCLALTACASLNGGSSSSIPLLVEPEQAPTGGKDAYRFDVDTKAACGQPWTTGCLNKAANKIFNQYMQFKAADNYKKYVILDHSYCFTLTQGSKITTHCSSPKETSAMDSKPSYPITQTVPAGAELDESAIYTVKYSR